MIFDVLGFLIPVLGLKHLMLQMRMQLEDYHVMRLCQRCSSLLSKSLSPLPCILSLL